MIWEILSGAGSIAPSLVEGVASSPNLEIRERFDDIERMMAQHPPVEMPPTHFFAPGIYARQIVIPGGTLLTGKIHRTAHLNVISRGSISVWSETEGVQRITAPFTFIAGLGTRRIGFAWEETVWTTVHATTETDLEKLEAELIIQHDALASNERQIT